MEAAVKRVRDTRTKGRPLLTWINAVKKDMMVLNLTGKPLVDECEWRRRFMYPSQKSMNMPLEMPCLYWMHVRCRYVIDTTKTMLDTLDDISNEKKKSPVSLPCYCYVCVSCSA